MISCETFHAAAAELGALTCSHHIPAAFLWLPCLSQVPKPDVILTSYEAFTADAAELKALTWEAVVLDERHPWQRAALAKAHTALCDLSARCVGGSRGALRGWQEAACRRL